MSRYKYKNKKVTPIALFASVIAVFSAVLLCIFVPDLFTDMFDDSEGKSQYYENPFYVSFIDVGQGDCSLISCNGVNVLVDGGEAEYADDVLTYLDDLGIEYLDCYVMTHPHSDHIGASSGIIDEISIGQVFTTYFSEFNIPTTRTYENALTSISNSEAEIVFVEAGDSFTYGDLSIDIIAPIEESSEYNDMSIVFTATYKDTTVLFTGDATVTVEQQILENGFDIEADVLKVAHHGSTTSSSDAFIDAVSPYIAVISCGEGNSYGHPHDEITEMLESKGIKYHRTDEGGTIVYYGDGKNMFTEAIG